MKKLKGAEFKPGYFRWEVRDRVATIRTGGTSRETYAPGPGVESALLEHHKVKECAVVAAPDPVRGHIVKAFVVLENPGERTPETVEELQTFVKSRIAPYEYPRGVEFLDSLPKTQSGKLQRFKLREPS